MFDYQSEFEVKKLIFKQLNGVIILRTQVFSFIGK